MWVGPGPRIKRLGCPAERIVTPSGLREPLMSWGMGAVRRLFPNLLN